ncbi:GK20579 [Caligus rogercresseyi]|uniref:GK20579 n=1 Tax=Caligus rogercresseyi TaxID=217165 RepID=A0A7T8KHR6_CALRO|nr:GK20579 [Caligus rogercresseyi]
MSGEEEYESSGFRIFRRKRLAPASIRSSSGLNRCLSTFDLTTLGIGATLGVGIYVLSGAVARDIAGPSIILSFLLAGIASTLSGLCYAELGSRVPLAGSAYVYSYVSIGEIIGFIIGWNLILEYAIGTASVAKGYSGYLDSLFGGIFSSFLQQNLPMSIPYLSSYPDLIALSITLLLTWILGCGVKESTRFNGVFTILNLSIVVFVIMAGLFKADLSNWSIPKESLPDHKFGEGGFFPYGVSGMLAGAATCFYGFVGFDAIATSGEEARDPGRSIPFISYFGISSIITLVAPYYLQDSNAPLPHIFNLVGLHWVGKLKSSWSNVSTSKDHICMANDGLIFRSLGHIHSTYRTPLRATILCGLLSGAMATLFELKNLVEMMSIGTLMAYTLIPNLDSEEEKGEYTLLCKDSQGEDDEEDEEIISIGSIGLELEPPKRDCLSTLFNTSGSTVPSKESSRVAVLGTASYTFFAFLLVGSNEKGSVFFPENALVFLDSLSLIGVFASLLIVWRQPQFTDSKSTVKGFRVPFLSAATWVRFVIWMTLGFMIYLFYGIRNSTEEYRRSGKPIPN